jgi:flagellar hook protein FlgE
VTFNPDGSLNTFTYASGGSSIDIDPANGANPLTVAINAGTAGAFSGVTQTEGTSTIVPREQDGYRSGSLSNISIDQAGQILGTFSNGTVLTLGQVMLAEFNNPGGMNRVGSNMFEVSGNSGIPIVSSPGESSNSSIVSGALEQSNVDLADEFTKMILAQRGFQANARVITTSDEFLTEVVNLKR